MHFVKCLQMKRHNHVLASVHLSKLVLNRLWSSCSLEYFEQTLEICHEVDQWSSEAAGVCIATDGWLAWVTERCFPSSEVIQLHSKASWRDRFKLMMRTSLQPVGGNQVKTLVFSFNDTVCWRRLPCEHLFCRNSTVQEPRSRSNPCREHQAQHPAVRIRLWFWNGKCTVQQRWRGERDWRTAWCWRYVPLFFFF